MAHVTTNAFENAPLLAGAGNLPVVIYSHGCVVYSAQHTYDSSPVVFPNGDVAEMNQNLVQIMLDIAAEYEKGGDAIDTQIAAFTGASFISVPWMRRREYIALWRNTVGNKRFHFMGGNSTPLIHQRPLRSH